LLSNAGTPGQKLSTIAGMAPEAVIGPEAFDSFGALLKHLRLRAGLTQRDLALAVGYHYAHISRLEHDERLPDSATLLALFIPALGLEDKPGWALRLLSLAAQARGEPLPPQFAHIQARTAVEVSQVELSEPSAAPGPVHSQVPMPLDSLLGREAELKALRQILLRPEVRLLTLVGPPGIGKTRLALQAAAELAGRFKHGAVFIDLAAVFDEDALAAAMAQALGVSEAADQPPAEAVAGQLRERHQLLVLDNFEQARSAAHRLASWLRAAPRVKALVTSRENLRVAGEHEFPVRPLQAPPALPAAAGTAPALDELSGYPAVQLFVERAQAVLPAFRLSADNAAAVAEICARLDGLPLAIELAAARVRLLSPQAMRQRLDQRLAWLAAGPHDTPHWRQTLRGAIDWSYDLLSPRERRLFAALAIFAGTFTAAAAEAVAEASLEEVGGLAGKSLLQVLPDAAGGETRLRLLELLREYAGERLQADPALEAQAARNHARYFLDLSERCGTALRGAQQAQALRTLDLEHDNVRAALRWAEAHEAPRGLQVCASLYRYWQWRGRLAEGRDWLRRLMAAAPSGPEPEPGRMRALHAAGVLAAAAGDFAEAGRCYNQALALANAAGNHELASVLLNSLAVTAHMAGDLDQAHGRYFELLAHRRRSGTPAQVGQTLNNIGVLLIEMGQPGAAEPYLREALAIRQDLDDEVDVAQTLHNLATATAAGDPAQAYALGSESLRIRRALGVVPGVIESLLILAGLELDQGGLPHAHARLIEALTLSVQHERRHDMAACLERLAWVAAAGAQAAPAGEQAELLRRAVWLLSAAERQRAASKTSLSADEAVRRASIQAAARAMLPPAAYAAAAITGGHADLQAITAELSHWSLVQ
jgi:predicted ATPase/transcriptional regulator with XRE-family HTH domain